MKKTWSVPDFRGSVGGVKYKPKEGTNECQFVTDEGCSVYEGRPTACRCYPIALKGDALEQHLARRGDRESVSHDDAERPSMAAYDMPLDGEDEEKSK